VTARKKPWSFLNWRRKKDFFGKKWNQISLITPNCHGDHMKILRFRTIHGPNTYHHNPVIVLRVDLEDLADQSSTDIPNFIEELLKYVPDVQNHTCSKGYPGGFLERLRTGTYLAHIIEHVALEFSRLCGMEVSYGKTRYAGEHGIYDIITRFANETGMKLCLKLAFDLVEGLTIDRPFDLPSALDSIRRETKKTELGPSGKALIEAAKKRRIPYRSLGDASLIEFGYGKNIRRVQTAVSDLTGLIATEIAQDKSLTKQLLSDCFIPVPNGIVAETESELLDRLGEIQTPLVVKPLDGNHGNGVSIGITTPIEAVKSFQIAKKFSDSVLIEEYCPGIDYRVLVVNGKVVAAAERIPPFVVGDGKSSIENLIQELNLDPRRGEGHENILTKISIDGILLQCLSDQSLTPQSIPQIGKKIILRKNANLSSGGSARDVTDFVHPEVRSACERAARIVGLDICGIDLIHTDISKPIEQGFKIIEVNAGPGLRMHLAPSEGQVRPVGDAIIDMLYPGQKTGRVPLTAITGTNGKTTVARLLHKILATEKFNCVGMTNTDGIWIGSERIASGDMTGPQSARVVLCDRKVDCAVLEVARGGILRAGLGYDWSDVGVITNVSLDHIGQDGIESIDDLIWIKSLVAERVCPGGTLVLNADSPTVMSMKDLARVKKNPKNYFLFSMDAQNSHLIEHLAKGGDCCWVRNGSILIQRRNQIIRLCSLHEIPITQNGTLQFQVANTLAAIAAASAHEVSPNVIKKALIEFDAIKENQGRMNFFNVNGGYLVIDYAHNPDAFASCCRFLTQLECRQKTAVFSLPGDRKDDLIRAAASEVAMYFDRFIIKEDKDLRGRKPGETATFIKQAILEANPVANVEIEPDESKAIMQALSSIKNGELVFTFFDSWITIQRSLSDFDAQPITELPLKDRTDFHPVHHHQSFSLAEASGAQASVYC
jgi:cyanophycin synthetase